jgi:hypothetical protein
MCPAVKVIQGGLAVGNMSQHVGHAEAFKIPPHDLGVSRIILNEQNDDRLSSHDSSPSF